MNSLFILHMELPAGNQQVEVFLPEPIADIMPTAENPLTDRASRPSCIEDAVAQTAVGDTAASRDARERAILQRMVVSLLASPVTPTRLAVAHRMTGVPRAGTLRQNMAWIECPASSRGRYYVPPADAIETLLIDLCRFVARNDVNAELQAATAYCQLIAIHPFSDGNGRLARALLCAVLRRHGVPEHSTSAVLRSLAAEQVRLDAAHLTLATGHGRPYWECWRRIFDASGRSALPPRQP